jgi:hypothetical protein
MPDADLTPRRKLVASLIAQGWSNTRIARHLGLSVTCIKDARRLPAVRAEIEAESSGLQEAMRFELVRALAVEERATFERWRELRDQNRNLPVALGAVRAHLDRVVPKAAVVEKQEPQVITITLEQQRLLEETARMIGKPYIEIDHDATHDGER